MSRPLKSFEQRCAEFWQRVDVRAPGECWPWTGAFQPFGYGIYKWQRRTTAAHRFAYLSKHGPDSIAADLVVRHKCDNPPCCNPAHLELGSRRENQGDMAERARSARGEKNAKARLTADQVVAIRQEHAAGVPIGVLADGYRVCKATIHHALSRRNWKHVP